MIRPRAGDFCYSRQEFETMKRDVEFCKHARVDGVVFGILTSNRTLDAQRMRLLVNRAHPLHVTVHRAVDEIKNWRPAVTMLRKLGVQRILTSGGKQSAMQGLKRIRAVTEYADGAIEVMPGSGITFRNVGRVLAIHGIRAVHVLSCVTEMIPATRAKLFWSSIRRVNSERVQRLIELLQQL
jgi:copper homeostasis protein